MLVMFFLNNKTLGKKKKTNKTLKSRNMFSTENKNGSRVCQLHFALVIMREVTKFLIINKTDKICSLLAFSKTSQFI